ncbi:hypothetical protein GA0074692_5293 [Micromonospora pallida]|uniref:Uncharacterized protein n=1 Tax=Micromonospora pallida TaxID=145854 RepID=A0A1C6TBQ6_9ACTN|nr:hypothetical protein GA0074692_5293 [Micromonospora pallida]
MIGEHHYVQGHRPCNASQRGRTSESQKESTVACAYGDKCGRLLPGCRNTGSGCRQLSRLVRRKTLAYLDVHRRPNRLFRGHRTYQRGRSSVELPQVPGVPGRYLRCRAIFHWRLGMQYNQHYRKPAGELFFRQLRLQQAQGVRHCRKRHSHHRQSGSPAVGRHRTQPSRPSVSSDAPPGQRSRRPGAFLLLTGGGCGIRTHEDIAALPVFKTTKLTALTCWSASRDPPCDTDTARELRGEVSTASAS